MQIRLGGTDVRTMVLNVTVPRVALTRFLGRYWCGGVRRRDIGGGDPFHLRVGHALDAGG